MRRALAAAGLILVLVLGGGACGGGGGGAGSSDAETSNEPAANVDPESDNFITGPVNQTKQVADDVEARNQQLDQ